MQKAIRNFKHFLRELGVKSRQHALILIVYKRKVLSLETAVVMTTTDDEQTTTVIIMSNGHSINGILNSNAPRGSSATVNTGSDFPSISYLGEWDTLSGFLSDR